MPYPWIFDPVIFDNDIFDVEVLVDISLTMRATEIRDVMRGQVNLPRLRPYRDSEPIMVPWQNHTILISKGFSTLDGPVGIILISGENRTITIAGGTPLSEAEPRKRPSRGRP